MSYSQAGQDLWLLDQFQPTFQGYAADIGAYDGVTHSNTLLLEQERRWTVLCVEPNPVVAKKLRANRAFVQICACDAQASAEEALYVHAKNTQCYTSLRPRVNHPVWHPDPEDEFIRVPTPVLTLDQCLERAEFPRLDLLCVDTEGMELDVLKGCDLDRWRPQIILAESWDEGTLDAHLAPLGYHRVRRMLVDDIYRRID